MVLAGALNHLEEKRKIIGKVFVEVFDKEAKKIKDVQWLAQGTIYPDIIESGGYGGSAKAVVYSLSKMGFKKIRVFKLHNVIRGFYIIFSISPINFCSYIT